MRRIKLIHYLLQILFAHGFRKSMAEIIITAVADLGGIYVKLIQFICLRTTIFSDNQKLRMLSFYDQVPLEPIGIMQIIRSELGAKAKSIREVETVPFASGTFGQVYKAFLIDGTQVVIKVKRPNLEKKLKFDFILMKISAKFFDFFIEQEVIDLQATLGEFEESTYQELHYFQEAKNADYFYKKYQNHPRVFIPKTYLDLCTDNILIQEYVQGISVTDLIRDKNKNPNEYQKLLHNFQIDPYVLFPQIAYDIALQGLLLDFFYADPHPGNIKLLPHNRYALIDFGIVSRSPSKKLLYYQMMAEIIKTSDDLDMKNVGKMFLKWGAEDFYNKIQFFDEFFNQGTSSLTELIVQKYESKLNAKRGKIRALEASKKEDFFQLLIDIISSGTELQVKVPKGMLLQLKTTVIYKSWVAYLEPNYHFMRDTYKRVIKNVDPAYLVDSYEEVILKPEAALESVLEWVEGIAESDMAAYKKIDNHIITQLYA